MITIYSTQICPRCKQLKAHLSQLGIPYQEADLLTLLQDAEAMTELHMRGQHFKAAPVLQVESAYHGPEEFFEGDKLDEKKLQELVK